MAASASSSSPNGRLRSVALQAARASGGAAGGGVAATSLAGAAAAVSKIAAPWEAVRGTLQKNFTARVQRFDAARVEAAVCTAVRAALAAGSGGLAAVDKASLACGPLFSWANASLDLAASLQAAGPLAAEMERLAAELHGLGERRAVTREELAALKRTLAALEVEMEALRREVEAEEAREAEEAEETEAGAGPAEVPAWNRSTQHPVWN